MSDAQDFLLAVDHDKQGALHIAEETAKKLETKQLTLIGVVQSLGEYINDEDATIRGKAVSYLTAVIAALPSKFLSRQQVQVLCQFYCDRIEDGGAIAGLSKLQELERFNNEMAGMTARAILEHFQDLQTRTQSQRFQILQLLNELMGNHRKALLDMGNESLVGITDLVAGEKDPRNLILIFSMLRVIMVEWNIEGHEESLFESVYCYFPITFRPPPNDPYGITAQDLKNRLRDCIASTKRFAPHALPALLDKLDSTSPNVKKDVLQTITTCALAWDSTTMSQYSITLWDALKFEILNAQEEDLAEEALDALRAVTERLSDGLTSTSPTSSLAQYLRPITNECNEQLQEPQHKQAKPAGQILKSLSSASTVAYTLIVKAVLAPLLTIYQDTGEIAKQRALLEVLNFLFDSAIELFGTWGALKAKSTLENPLEPFRDRLSELYSQALMGTVKEEVSFRITALKGLLRLTNIRDFLQDNEIGLTVQYLDEIVLVEESYGRDDLKKAAIQGLAEISIYKPRLIMDITFPAFMAKLPDSARDGQADYLTTLEGLAQISVEKDIFETLVRRLLSKLDVLLHQGPSNSPDFVRAILSTILFVMDRRGMDNDSNLESYFDKIVVNLVQRAALANTETSQASPLTNDTVLDVLGRLSNLIVRSLPRHKQIVVSNNIYTLFSVDNGFTPVPFTATTTPTQRQTMILSTYLLASLPRDLPSLPYTDPDMISLLQELIRLSSNEGQPATRLAVLRQIALLVNKFLPTPSLPLASSIITTLLEPPTPSTIRATFYLSKALLLRLAPSSTQILTSLLTLLSHPNPSVAQQSARGFSLLLFADPLLTTTKGAHIRKLAPQRIFTTLIPQLSSLFRNSTTNPQARENYLIALSGLLSSTTIPTEILTPELPTLLPLLLQSLDLHDQAVKAATLETLAVVIRENSKALVDSGHVDSLVKRLLKTATFIPIPTPTKTTPRTSVVGIEPSGTAKATTTNTINNTPGVRLLATHCLTLFPTTIGKTTSSLSTTISTNPLLQLQKQVIRGLAAVLDDPRRDVRKEAVDAKGAWERGVDDEGDEEDD